VVSESASVREGVKGLEGGDGVELLEGFIACYNLQYILFPSD